MKSRYLKKARTGVQIGGCETGMQAFQRYFGKNETVKESKKWFGENYWIKDKDGKKVFNLENHYFEFLPWAIGGYIAHNPEYKGQVLTDRNIGCIDLHFSYICWLYTPMPYGSFLEEPPDGPFLTYIAVRIDWFKQKDNKYPPFLKIRRTVPLADTYLKEFDCPDLYYYELDYFKLLLELYDMKYEIIEEFYIACKVYLDECADHACRDKLALHDKSALKGVGCFHFCPIKDNGEPFDHNVLIYSPVWARVAELTRIHIQRTILKIIDAGGTWINTCTDSIMFEADKIEWKEEGLFVNDIFICELQNETGYFDNGWEDYGDLTCDTLLLVDTCTYFAYNSKLKKYAKIRTGVLKVKQDSILTAAGIPEKDWPYYDIQSSKVIRENLNNSDKDPTWIFNNWIELKEMITNGVAVEIITEKDDYINFVHNCYNNKKQKINLKQIWQTKKE